MLGGPIALLLGRLVLLLGGLMLLPGGLMLLLDGPEARAIGPSSRVEIAQLLLPGQAGGPHPGLVRVARAVQERTNVSMRKQVRAVAPSSASVATHPLLWSVVEGPLPPLPGRLVTQLGRALRRGGTWVIDGPSAPVKREPFLASVRRALRRVLPGSHLASVPSDHTLFKSFYLLAPDQIRLRWGAVQVVERDRRAAVIVAHGMASDLGPSPSRSAELEWQIRLAVNIVLYALCVDYKSDQVHAAAILRRRSRGPLPRLAPSPASAPRPRRAPRPRAAGNGEPW